MPYRHAGEVGDVWKHLPLCEILKIEKPLKYHESNAAYAGYAISENPKTGYGVFRALRWNSDVFHSSEYCSILKKNGIDGFHYTGSPGLAMETLLDKARYFFHDIEQEALDDIEAFAGRKGLRGYTKTYCGDSIRAFLDEKYLVDENDFLFLDPYSPLDKNGMGASFFDIFDKSIAAKSKTLMWYGYESLNGKDLIMRQLKRLANRNNVKISSFDAWQKSMDAHGCEINPGVPGCGLACAHLSSESIAALRLCLGFVADCYAHAAYCGNEAALFTGMNEFY